MYFLLLSSYYLFVLCLFYHTASFIYFQLFDRIQSRVLTPLRTPLNDAVQCARDAADALRDLEHRRDTDFRDLQELRDLLCRPHFKVKFVWLLNGRGR